MANHKSAIKRHRQSLKRNAANKSIKARVRTAIKAARAAITAKEANAEELLRIEKLPMVITFCSRHHPYEKLINVGSDEKGEEIYFFNYEKKLLDIKQDLSKLYVFNLRTFLWEERQLDVSKIRCRDLKVDSFRSTNDTIYFFKEIRYSRRIACYFAFLDIESLTWNEHWVYFDRYGFPYDMDMAGHSFYGFMSAGAKNFFLFARKDKEPYLLKWQTVSPQNKELIPSSY